MIQSTDRRVTYRDRQIRVERSEETLTYHAIWFEPEQQIDYKTAEFGTVVDARKVAKSMIDLAIKRLNWARWSTRS